jgi:hypothetical protein
MENHVQMHKGSYRAASQGEPRWSNPATLLKSAPGVETAFVATGITVWIGVAFRSVVTVLGWI